MSRKHLSYARLVQDAQFDVSRGTYELGICSNNRVPADIQRAFV